MTTSDRQMADQSRKEIAKGSIPNLVAAVFAAAPTEARAHLVIHAGPRLLGRWQALPRFAGWLVGRTHTRGGPSLNLTVQDLEGHRIGIYEPADPVTRLRLTPGTYVVVASNGSERRTYTMTLSAGTSFELYIDTLQPSRPLPSIPG